MWLKATSRARCRIAVVVVNLLLAPEVGQACDQCGPSCRCGPTCRCAVSQTATPKVSENASVNVRKNASTLTDAEKLDFVEAVLALKERPAPGSNLSIYDTFVLQHLQSFTDQQAHGGPAFLPWHRQFLLEFERELQKVNPNVTIPYWDFTNSQATAAIFSPNFMGGNGEPNTGIVRDGPFGKDMGRWIVHETLDGPDLRREFGLAAPTLPTAADVQAALAVMIYDVFPFDRGSPVDESFRNFLEGFNHSSGEAELHNRVHSWLGGSSAIALSPNDPIFWLLHANIDRLWGEWQDQNGLLYQPEVGALPGHNLHDPMAPFGVSSASVLDQRALGYVYDSQLGSQIVPEPSALMLFVFGGVGLLVLIAQGRRRFPQPSLTLPARKGG